MAHQRYFNPSYMLETENDPSWNFAENIYAHTDNMSIDGAQYTHCNHTPTSNAYSSLPHNLQIPNYQQDVAGPSDLSMHTHTPSAYVASSSNYSGNPFNEEDLFDIRIGNARVHSKRKSPGVPDGQSSGQSSSDVVMVNEPWQESQPANFLQAPWDYHTTNPIGLSIGAENSLRNVRSRSTFDLEANSMRNHLENNMSCDFYTSSQPMDVSVSPSINLNSNHLSSVAQDISSISYELNPFLQGSSTRSSLIVNPPQNNNHALRNFPSSSASVRAIPSGYIQSQRSVPTFRLSSTNVTDDRLRLATNGHPSHPPRPSSTVGWPASDRRYRSLSRVNYHDRPPSQGLMIVDRSTSNGSRNPFDQHRDMRLDIDDMSYEELLALGERIGSVGTGLSDHLISKCMQVSIYCSSDQMQDEGTCAICLEEYANMDDVGMLRVCRHDFHVGCIRKWLSMKNSCPICKAEPMKQK
ncbi:putative transcription factor C2H2 family [Helianthus anomalus]